MKGTEEVEDIQNTAQSTIRKILAKGIRQKKLPTLAITKQKYWIPQKKGKDSHQELETRVEELSRAVQRLEKQKQEGDPSKRSQTTFCNWKEFMRRLEQNFSDISRKMETQTQMLVDLVEIQS